MIIVYCCGIVCTTYYICFVWLTVFFSYNITASFLSGISKRLMTGCVSYGAAVSCFGFNNEVARHILCQAISCYNITNWIYLLIISTSSSRTLVGISGIGNFSRPVPFVLRKNAPRNVPIEMFNKLRIKSLFITSSPFESVVIN